MRAVADGTMKEENFASLTKENVELIKPPLEPGSRPDAGL
jgi:hypothetical protein